jgi:glycosyltransferase involved in cell wall biosynthesis
MELAKGLIRVAGRHELVVLANEAYPESIGEIRDEVCALSDRVRFATYALADLEGAHGEQRRRIQALNDRLLNWHYARVAPDVVHVSSVFEGWVTGAAHVSTRLADLSAVCTSATLYDLIPYLFKDRYLSAAVEAAYLRNLAVFDQVDVVHAISESARRDAIAHLGLDPDRIVNIRGAASDHFRVLAPLEERARRDLLARWDIEDRFLMYTGGIDYRKNIEGLIDAYAMLPERLTRRVQLAVVCRATEEQKADMLRHARRAGVADGRVVMTGFVTDDELVALYNLCELFVFPSLYEGFGLPVLEAMKCGRCVAAANRSSLPELVTDPRALFDPYEPADIARVVTALLDDDGVRREIAEAGAVRARAFTWDACAAAMLEGIENATARRRQGGAIAHSYGRRPRIAYFSPLPDRRSGIADYSAHLLPLLSRYQDIDAFVDGYQPAHPRSLVPLPVLDAADYPSRRSRYDTAVYHFGNSEFHVYMYDLALEHPGILVMHDFFLSGMLQFMASRRGDPSLLEREILYSHGREGEEAVRAHRAGQRTLESLIYDFPANRRLLERARGIVFHSAYSADLFRSTYPDLWRIPVAIVPHFAQATDIVAADRRRIRRELGVADDDVLIASFGYIAPTKQSELLIEALSDPRLARIRHLHVHLVGELTEGEYGRLVRDLVRRSPHRDRIRITGYVSETDYQRHLVACDVVVSLRTRSRGETSGALHRALGAGVPCIVSDRATLAELPRDIVRHVAPDSVPALAESLGDLIGDPALRARLGAAARRHADSTLGPERIAEGYAIAINRFIGLARAVSGTGLAEGLAIAESDFGAAPAALRQAANIVSRALSPPSTSPR